MIGKMILIIKRLVFFEYADPGEPFNSEVPPGIYLRDIKYEYISLECGANCN